MFYCYDSRSYIKKIHFINEKNLIQKNDKRHISDKMMSIIRQKSAEFTMQVYYTIRLTDKTLLK
ncbi:hypothetical protein MCCC1A01412_23685 [Bacillus anthracis]|nr:hypothetical protein DY471_09530 [Bacillus anthracis]OJD85207.1 hypothetical protein MCCC1A01412_23685 [Bacillus anthracis]OWW09132.1 hypothetical protein BUE63_16545 [Bacillus sp. MB353a]PGB55815.1 hypothetical protein COL95_05725 [Bacillus anthracis]